MLTKAYAVDAYAVDVKAVTLRSDELSNRSIMEVHMHSGCNAPASGGWRYDFCDRDGSSVTIAVAVLKRALPIPFVAKKTPATKRNVNVST